MSKDNDNFIDISIEKPESALPVKKIQTAVSEEPAEILKKVAGWASKGKELNVSSKDGLRHLLAESRDRSSMFMSVLALQRMKRVANLVGIAEDVQEKLFSPERLEMMDTNELLQALKLIQSIVKENIEFISKSTEDSSTGAQILINMVDARSLTLSREDVPEAKSRESVRHAVAGLIDAFGIKEDTEIIDAEVVDADEGGNP